MAYATKQDMIDRFGEAELIELTDDDGLAIDDVEVDTALSDASELIDSILGVRYVLPLAPVPGILVTYTCDIARYELHDELPGEHVTAKRDFAIQMLKDIAQGKSGFGPNGPAALDPDTGAGSSAGEGTIDSSDLVFTDSKLNGFLP